MPHCLCPMCFSPTFREAGAENWGTEGCQTLTSTVHTKCLCSRISTYAVLAQQAKDPVSFQCTCLMCACWARVVANKTAANKGEVSNLEGVYLGAHLSQLNLFYFSVLVKLSTYHWCSRLNCPNICIAFHFDQSVFVLTIYLLKDIYRSSLKRFFLASYLCGSGNGVRRMMLMCLCAI